jgi:outer membrane scaffolding protein for murein synthesis (MipA/OmpV family)
MLACGASWASGSLLLIDPVPAASTLAGGVTVRAWPDSTNAGTAVTRVWPAFDYYADAGVFVSTDNAVGWNLSRREDLQFGLRLWPQPGRDVSKLPAGLDRLGLRVQEEAFANWQALPALLLQSGYSFGAGRNHRAQQLELGVTTGVPLGQGLIGLGFAANYADREFRNSYFGVTEQEAARAQIPAWNLGNGWQDTSMTLSFEQHFGARWVLDGQLLRTWLLGAAADSPLARQRLQHAATLTLWHTF